MGILEPWQVAWVASQIWKDRNTATIATAISFTEDRSHDTAAVNINANGSKDLGLWQINDKAHADLMTNASGWSWGDPQGNAKMAFTIWQSAGGSFNPWTTYTNGTYQLQMAAANQAFLDAVKKAVEMPTQSIWDQLGSLASTTPISNDASGVAQLASLTAFFDEVGAFFAKLGDPKFWASVGIVIAGGIMLIIIAYRLLKSSKTVQKSTKGVTKIAEVAALA